VVFDSFCVDLVVTSTTLCFQALKGKEEKMVENAPIQNPSGDHPEVAVNVKIEKIMSQYLASSEVQETTKTVAGATPNNGD
jgi:hypothetical protein